MSSHTGKFDLSEDLNLEDLKARKIKNSQR